MSDTETIDRLFLELSQFTKAETEKEIALRDEVERLRSALKQITLPEATWTRSDIDFITRRALDGEE